MTVGQRTPEVVITSKIRSTYWRRFSWRRDVEQRCQITHTTTAHKKNHTQTYTHLLTLFVSRFSDSLSLTGSISQGLCSVQICEDLKKVLKYPFVLTFKDILKRHGRQIKPKNKEGQGFSKTIYMGDKYCEWRKKQYYSFILYLIYDWLECDLQIVHSCQLHGLINALRSQRVSPENGVRISTKGGRVCFGIQIKTCSLCLKMKSQSLPK